MATFSAWLDGTAGSVFALCATLFVAINAGAIAVVFIKRDRAIVNRWTARWLAANLALLGAGAGVPLTAKLVRMTIDAVTATRALRSTPSTTEAAETQERAIPDQR